MLDRRTSCWQNRRNSPRLARSGGTETSTTTDSPMARTVDYDHIAKTYDRRYRENDYSGIEAALMAFVGEHSDQHILEVGCGTGHWLQSLDGAGIRLAGADASARMLAHARVQAPRAALVQGAAERLPWKSESFDRVFCINALHHFQDKIAFLTEAMRVLRPGGQLMTVGSGSPCRHRSVVRLRVLRERS
jgi:ubiquinone/menaquinone biosynthesis C-methylase UbiE